MSKANHENEKRQWLDSLESLRQETSARPRQVARERQAESRQKVKPSAPTTSNSSSQTSPERNLETRLQHEIVRMREALRISTATCNLLEEEIKSMERKALEAIAENGRLRKRLDEVTCKEIGKRPALPATQKLFISRRNSETQVGYERVHDLLTEALCDSEREISRLTQALGVIVRKVEIS